MNKTERANTATDALQAAPAVGAQVERGVRPQPAGKWCRYCRKHDHSDAECWCTRAVGPDWKPTPAMSMEIFRESSAAAARDRADRIEAALSELVSLEDMRLRLSKLHEMGHGTEYCEYHRRLPEAWAAARAALLGPNVRANLDPTA